ncbi:MAG TPA: methyl-accepting chemotaxis protein [Spirochaetia bacterium]|nr:methyl-accepting chemotaxis protein [Spirochaetia bacterium]
MNTLRTKLLISIISAIVILLSVSFFSIGSIANSGLRDLMEEDARNIAQKNAEKISSLFTEAYAFTYANAAYQEFLQRSGQTDREAFKRYLAYQLEKHEPFFALWTQFEPNAWDGRDSFFAGKPGYAENGLYSPWVFRDNGKVRIDTTGTYTETEDYYTVAKSTKKPFVTVPYQDKALTGQTTMMTTISMPLFDESGSLIGVTGTDIILKTFQALIENLTLFESGYGTIIAQDGTLVAHPNTASIGKNVKELDSEEANKLLFDTCARGVVNSTRTYSVVTQQDILRIFAPIEIQGTGQRWVFAASIPLKEVNVIPNRIIRLMAVFMVGFVVVLSIIIIILASRIVSPIKVLADGIHTVSTGDFTRKVNVKTKDEIGRIAYRFNEFIDTISSMLKDTKETSHRLNEVGELLSEEMSQTSSAVTQIAAASKNARTIIEQQAESVSSVSEVMETIAKQVDALGGLIEIQSANITESSASIEEMVANIRSVTSNVSTAASMTRELVQASSIGKEKMSTVTSQVREIAEQSEKLIEMNSIIANIASQTNLLAMNAAIEAAHAGNAGKGFSVVADEVRKLAELSKEQSMEIRQHLKEVTSIIDSVAVSTEDASLSFDDINKLVSDVDNIQETIRHAMSEQSEGSKQILAALEEMNQATSDVSGGAHDMRLGTSKINTEIENLVILSGEVKQGITEIATGASNIEASVVQVREISERNKELIADVLEKTEQFKVS